MKPFVPRVAKMRTRMTDQSRKTWIRSASLVLAILSFINLFNYLDRYIVSALVESLKHSELNAVGRRTGLADVGVLDRVHAGRAHFRRARRSALAAAPDRLRRRLLERGDGAVRFRWEFSRACSRRGRRSASARRLTSRSRPASCRTIFPAANAAASWRSFSAPSRWVCPRLCGRRFDRRAFRLARWHFSSQACRA